ncbi:MAG: NAD(P)H-quinone oxidoreductase [Betaproteobacteria bacterium]|nr:MAG: NAD(P)H-quinone oxidoreductase [Betaproteobacteria bacterium]
MTAVSITAAGGPEMLKTESRPVPRPGAGQVLIKVAYAGINRHDCSQRKRGFGPKGATDIPGLEVAGEVVAVGPDVTRWKVGDRACALVNGGGYAQYCIAQAPLLLPVPAGYDLKQAACLPEAMFTAWFNIFHLGRLARGEWLLVHGGSSGVGTIAIQLGRLEGASVITTAGSSTKCDACLKLGAQHAVNYKEADFVAEVKKATAERGVDVILDMVGGAYAKRNLESLAPDGRLVHISSGGPIEFCTPISAIAAKRAVVTASQMRPLPLDKKQAVVRDLLDRVWPHLGTRIDPVLDSVFTLEQAGQSHARMESSQHIGKILLEVNH